jgi:hypothetical protein
MRMLLSFVAAAAVLAAPLAMTADAAKGEWTGYVTDTHCGANGATRDHTAACVEKCMKGGSKAELYIESEKKSYPLNDFSKVKALVGQRVTVKGTQDAASGTITVESAAKASS